MGFFTNETHPTDMNYGEAIVEARLIKEVGMFFLEQCNMDISRKDNFLTSTTNLINNANALFTFLCNAKKNFSDNRFREKMIQCLQ